MADPRRLVEGFLGDRGMAPEQANLGTICESFRSEMKKGLAGERSSLYMIPTYVGVPE